MKLHIGTIEIILLVIVNIGYFGKMLVTSDDNYGPYTVDFTHSELCVGPKPTNISHCTLEVKKNKEDYIAYINLTVMVPCELNVVKVKTYGVEKQRKTLLLNRIVNNPCQHYVLAAVIEKYFKSRKCMIEKGHYVIELNLSNVAHKFYGQTSYYGEFQYKTTVISKQGNILCWIKNVVFKKKM